MSQHEHAPKEFVSTFNAAWDWGMRGVVIITVILLAMFFYNLADSWGAFFMTFIIAVLAYGAWRLFAALFIGPGDADEKSGH